MNVLITSSAAKVPLISSLRGRSNDQFERVFAGDCDPKAVSRWFADGFWEMPPTVLLTVDEVVAFCTERNVELIVPTRDGELLWWADHREDLAAAGIHVMVSTSIAVSLCLDKLGFSRILMDHKFPAVPARSTIDDLEGDRFVVKEQYGAGSRRMLLDVPRAQADPAPDDIAWPIWQPYVEGTEYSVDLYVAQSGETLGVIVRERQVVRGGEAQVTRTAENPNLAECCSRIAQFLGIRGHAVLQAIVDEDGNPHVLECNPRFGGASTLSVAAGLRTFEWAAREAVGGDPTILRFEPARQSVQQVRYAQDAVWSP